MELRRFLSLLMLAIIVSLAMVVWFYPTSRDFMAENPFWNGAEAFSDSFDASPIRSSGDLPQNPEGTVLVVIPYTAFSDADLAALNSYVSDGGTLVLADDYGYGNTVLDYLQLDASFNGELLLDPLFNYKNGLFPRVTDLISSTLTQGVESIVLNHATAIGIGAGIEPVARSSASSFIDVNGNQVWEQGEPTGPFVVAAQASLGKGSVIMVSDPSIIINCMQDMDDNHAFISNIMQLGGADSQVMLDESHLPGANLDAAKSGLAVIRDAMATPAGKIIILTAIVALALLPIWFNVEGGRHGTGFKRKRHADQNT